MRTQELQLRTVWASLFVSVDWWISSVPWTESSVRRTENLSSLNWDFGRMNLSQGPISNTSVKCTESSVQGTEVRFPGPRTSARWTETLVPITEKLRFNLARNFGSECCNNWCAISTNYFSTLYRSSVRITEVFFSVYLSEFLRSDAIHIRLLAHYQTGGFLGESLLMLFSALSSVKIKWKIWSSMSLFQFDCGKGAQRNQSRALKLVKKVSHFSSKIELITIADRFLLHK